MPDRLITPPTGEPVSLDEAKTQIALEGAEDDEFVTSLIRAAREHVESHCNRAMLEQTWETVLDAFPHNGHHWYSHHSCFPMWSGIGYGGHLCKACHLFVELGHGQLATLEDDDPAVASVKYYDPAGTLQTLATSEYSVDTASIPGRIHRAPGKSWPQTQRRWDAVTIRYTVGWATSDDVPDSLKQAIKLLVSQMYEHRTPEVDSRALTPVLFSYEALLSPHKVFHL